jgi:hypothetical protein
VSGPAEPTTRGKRASAARRGAEDRDGVDM